TGAQFRDINFNNQNYIFNSGFLSNLADLQNEPVRDEKRVAYIPFKNVVVRVTADGLEVMDYSMFKGKMFFKSQIIDADFDESIHWKKCHFAKFVRNISNNDRNRKDS